MLSIHPIAFSTAGLLFALWGPSPWLAASQLIALILAFDRPRIKHSLLFALIGFCVGQIHWHQGLEGTDQRRWILTVAKDTVSTSQRVELDHPLGRVVWRYSNRRWCAGTKLQLEGRLEPPVTQSHHGSIAPYRHRFAKGTIGELKRVRGVTIQQLPSPVALALCQVRQGVSDHLMQVLSARSRHLAHALFLGERLPELRDTQQMLNSLGLTHLIAVSGLHVGLVLGLLILSLRLPCLITPQYRLAGWRLRWIVLAGALVISAWCAWPVGGVRLCVWAAVACFAPHRPLQVTGWVSLAILLGVEPRHGADLGFLLSHGISLALIHAVKARPSALTVPLVATLSSAPILALVGLPVAWLGAAVNLALVPVFSLVLVLAGASLCLSAPIPADHGLNLFLDLAGTLSSASPSPFMSPRWSIATALGVFLMTMALIQRRTNAAILCLSTALFTPPKEPGTRVWMLPIGHGDMALVESQGSQVVIDTGPSKYGVLNHLLPRLERPPELMIISHADQDHIGGAQALCLHHQPRRVWSQSSILGCPRADQTQNLHLKSMTISRLSRADDWVRGRNERSLIVSINANGHRLLFLGDIGMDRELDLAGRFGRATVVKVPHHGSKTSSGLPLIEETQPQIALIGAGPADRFFHPHPAVVDRWRQSGAQVETADRQARCWVLTSGRAGRRCAALAYERQSP